MGDQRQTAEKIVKEHLSPILDENAYYYFVNILEALQKKASAWDRVKSICCEDGTFLKREHIEEIERQESK